MYEYQAIWMQNKYSDGDTVWFEVDLGFRTSVKVEFRLHGIDTPERFTPEGKLATQYVKDWLLGHVGPKGQVLIRTEVAPKTGDEDQEKYGRYLCEIFSWGEWPRSLNQELLEQGLAKPYFGGKKG